jgi:transcriptional regulator with XRE-family HTH domain
VDAKERPMEEKRFGDVLKSLRVKKGLTLREFARRLGKDVGNLSKLERGLLPPSKDEEILRDFGRVLGLKESSDEFRQLAQLAAIGAGQIPKDVLEDEQLLAKLPIFFRTATGSKLDRKKLMEFLDQLKKA